MGLYGTFFVFSSTPWWSPQVMIPTCGLIIGNTVSGPAVVVERLLSDVSEKSYELETRLSFGSTCYESVLPIVRTSLLAAFMPTLNQLAVYGLVYIPGMMTGQLLGGTSPSVAAEHQMALLYLLVSTSSITTITALGLAVKNAVFDVNEHRLTLNKIIITKKKTSEVDVVLVDLFRSLYNQLLAFFIVFQQRIFPSPSFTSDHSLNTSQYHPVNTLDIESHEAINQTTEVEDDSTHHFEMPSMMLNAEYTSFLASYEINENNNCRTSARKRDCELLRLVQLNVKSGENNTLFAVNSGLDLKIYQSEIVSIEGRSGFGKTRLLKAIAALDLPFQGYCCYKQSILNSTAVKRRENDSNVQSSGEVFWEVPKWRTHIVFISQV
jgi:ABC-type multidrug transport system fused ATPase/permease subunit